MNGLVEQSGLLSAGSGKGPMACSPHGEHDDSMMRAIDVSITDNVARTYMQRPSDESVLSSSTKQRNCGDQFQGLRREVENLSRVDRTDD